MFEPVDVASGLPSSDLLGECSCCAANEDNVEGEGTGFATSNDWGLALGEKAGIENVRASAASDGNADNGVGEAVKGVGEDVPDATKLSVALVREGIAGT